jgi:hypothetical protein
MKKMKNDQITFLYFADEQGKQTNIAYAPGFYWGEHLEDISVKCEIIDEEIILSPVIEPWMNKSEIKALNSEFSNYNIYDSWEYLDFYQTKELDSCEDYLGLYANKNSSTFDILNSTQNIKNLKNMENKLKLPPFWLKD